LIIIGTSSEAIVVLKAKMKNRFKMSDLSLLSYYLGIEFKQSKDGIFHCQQAYAGKLLEWCSLGGCNPTASPIESHLKLSRQIAVEAANATEYRSIVNTLRYLLHIRPDMAFLVRYLSHFMEEPHTDHLADIKCVFWYVAGTQGHKLHYIKHGDNKP
jgi:hypothetical protein